MENVYLEETLSAIGEILPSFSSVKIDYAALERSAKAIAFSDFSAKENSGPQVYPKNFRALPSYHFFINTINFCFAHNKLDPDGRLVKFSVKVPFSEKPLRGSYAMVYRFYDLFGENPISADMLLEKIATFSRFERNFHGINSMPMLRERWEMLAEAANVLNEKFGGDVMNLMEESGFSTAGGNGKIGLLELLVTLFPKAYGDDWFFDGEGGYFSPSGAMFYFFKRAQLFISNYHADAILCRSLRPISDPENIGPMVDYVVPRGYFIDKVLIYHPELEQKIRKAVPIERHSKEELEIRSATYLSFYNELVLINAIRVKNGLQSIGAHQLDSYRWSRGLEDSKQMPHHLCFSTDY